MNLSILIKLSMQLLSMYGGSNYCKYEDNWRLYGWALYGKWKPNTLSLDSINNLDPTYNAFCHTSLPLLFGLRLFVVLLNPFRVFLRGKNENKFTIVLQGIRRCLVQQRYCFSFVARIYQDKGKWSFLFWRQPLVNQTSWIPFLYNRPVH